MQDRAVATYGRDVAGLMQRVLAEAADAIEVRLAFFFQNPQDVEAMHKLRVSIRTARSLVAFVKPYQVKQQNRCIQEDLRAVVGETSRLRELDVLAVQVGTLDPPADELLDVCMSLCAEERERVKGVLDSAQVQHRLTSACAALRGIAWKGVVLREGVAPEALQLRYSEMAAAVERQLAVLDLCDAELTHTVRKRAKRVRYVSEKFAALLPKDAARMAKAMMRQQDGLGAVCDARANLAIIESFPVEGLSACARNDLALLRATNEVYLYTALRAR